MHSKSLPPLRYLIASPYKKGPAQVCSDLAKGWAGGDSMIAFIVQSHRTLVLIVSKWVAAVHGSFVLSRWIMSLMIGSCISCWKQQAQIQSHNKKTPSNRMFSKSLPTLSYLIACPCKTRRAQACSLFSKGCAGRDENDCVHCAIPFNTCIDWLQ